MKCASIAVPGPAFRPGATCDSFSACRVYSMAASGDHWLSDIVSPPMVNYIITDNGIFMARDSRRQHVLTDRLARAKNTKHTKQEKQSKCKEMWKNQTDT